MGMKTKPAGEFAKLVPPDEPARSIFGCMADKIKIAGDIESPVLPPIEQWDMHRRPWAADLRAVAKSRARRRIGKPSR
jgi:hypothetical protein